MILIIIICTALGLCVGTLISWLFWNRRENLHRKRIQAFTRKAESLSRDYQNCKEKSSQLEDQLNDLKTEGALDHINLTLWRRKYLNLLEESRKLDSRLKNSPSLKPGKSSEPKKFDMGAKTKAISALQKKNLELKAQLQSVYNVLQNLTEGLDPFVIDPQSLEATESEE